MITPEEWNRLLVLAKLELPEEERLSLQADLEAMVAFAQKMENISLEKSDEILLGRSSDTLREDALGPSLNRSRILQNAPETEEGFFLTKGNF